MNTKKYRAVSDCATADVRLIKATALWCGFLQGAKPALEALRTISEATEAEAVTLVRMPHGGSGKTQSVSFDARKPTLGMPRIEKSFSGMVLGNYARSAEPGTVWLRSIIANEADVQALDDLQRRRGWNELAIVPLSQSSKSMDLLELHFAGDSARWHNLSLNMVAGTLAETWANRKPGLLTEAFLQRSVRETQPEKLLPLLSCENPARLSRAEFRVCLLLGQGLSNERITAELGISLATLSTHQRNTYAKTGSDGHSELLYKLLNFVGNRAELTARLA